MKKLIFGLALLLAVTNTTRGDFILSGTEYLEVTSTHTTGILNGSSSADVKQGANVTNLYVNDASSIDMSDGVIGTLESDDAGSVSVSAGTTASLIAYGSSTLEISGGDITSTLTTYEKSNATISGGSITRLEAYSGSSVAFSGGDIPMFLKAHENSNITISGGNLGYLAAYDTSGVDILGGSITELVANHDSNVTFYGYDFSVTGDLILEDGRLLGKGVLAGRWLPDETMWSISIPGIMPTAMVQVITITDPMPGDANRDGLVDVTDLGILATNYDAGSGFGWEDADFTGDGVVNVSDLGILATYYGNKTEGTTSQAVPEPGTTALLLCGLVGLALRRRRPACH